MVENKSALLTLGAIGVAGTYFYMHPFTMFCLGCEKRGFFYKCAEGTGYDSVTCDVMKYGAKSVAAIEGVANVAAEYTRELVVFGSRLPQLLRKILSIILKELKNAYQKVKEKIEFALEHSVEFMKKAIKEAKQTAQYTLHFIVKNIIDPFVQSIMSYIVDPLQQILSKISQFMVEVKRSIDGVFSKAFNSLKGTWLDVEDFMTQVTNTVDSTLDEMSRVFVAMMTRVENTINDTTRQSAKALETGINGFTGVAENQINNSIGFFINSADSVLDGLEATINGSANVVAGMMNGIIMSINQGVIKPINYTIPTISASLNVCADVCNDIAQGVGDLKDRRFKMSVFGESIDMGKPFNFISAPNSIPGVDIGTVPTLGNIHIQGVDLPDLHFERRNVNTGVGGYSSAPVSSTQQVASLSNTNKMQNNVGGFFAKKMAKNAQRKAVSFVDEAIETRVITQHIPDDVIPTKADIASSLIKAVVPDNISSVPAPTASNRATKKFMYTEAFDKGGNKLPLAKLQTLTDYDRVIEPIYENSKQPLLGVLTAYEYPKEWYGRYIGWFGSNTHDNSYDIDRVWGYRHNTGATLIKGFFVPPKQGVYTFRLRSNTAAMLVFGTSEVVIHKSRTIREQSGSMHLSRGKPYWFRLMIGQRQKNTPRKWCQFSWKDPANVEYTSLNDSFLPPKSWKKVKEQLELSDHMQTQTTTGASRWFRRPHVAHKEKTTVGFMNDIKKATNTVADGTVDAAHAVADGTIDAANFVADGTVHATNQLATTTSSVYKEAVAETGDWVAGTATAVGDFSVNTYTDGFNTVVKPIGNAGKVGIAAIGNYGAVGVTFAKDLRVDDLRYAGKMAWKGTTTAYDVLPSNLQNLLERIAYAVQTNAVDQFGNMIHTVDDIGGGTMKAMLDIGDAFVWFGEAVEQAANDTYHALKSVFGANSFSFESGVTKKPYIPPNIVVPVPHAPPATPTEYTVPSLASLHNHNSGNVIKNSISGVKIPKVSIPTTNITITKSQHAQDQPEESEVMHVDASIEPKTTTPRQESTSSTALVAPSASADLMAVSVHRSKSGGNNIFTEFRETMQDISKQFVSILQPLQRSFVVLLSYMDLMLASWIHLFTHIVNWKNIQKMLMESWRYTKKGYFELEEFMIENVVEPLVDVLLFTKDFVLTYGAMILDETYALLRGAYHETLEYLRIIGRNILYVMKEGAMYTFGTAQYGFSRLTAPVPGNLTSKLYVAIAFLLLVFVGSYLSFGMRHGVNILQIVLSPLLWVDELFDKLFFGRFLNTKNKGIP